MFNNLSFRFIKTFSLILLTSISISCKDDITLDFSEMAIIDEDETTIEINIPKAEGKTEAAKQINTSLILFVNTALNIEADSNIKTSTEESILDFKKAYKDFKTQIGKTLYTNLPPWEILIDGEIIYKSETLVSIAMNSSINTGGAHSNLVFKFYNFDVSTGQELETKDLINDVSAFTTLAEKYFNKELLSADNDRIEAFNNDMFKLPDNLGFSDDGVIVLYDTFNTSTNNVIEFTIPYTVADKYLNF
ncbi:DUF4163 domain-containing protein [Lacinutrix sp.]|uniref:DUF4163 domain-containing protein n=1 Tax=Lacinutrix sp. TaxID=1937692 RepID=UPI002603EABC|nr:DUF4163 domain-containing protein [Lacinutrix sp.]MDG1714342.1 DUF4163 domain-containing protein [Lacinutrix sp.]